MDNEMNRRIESMRLNGATEREIMLFLDGYQLGKSAGKIEALEAAIELCKGGRNV